MDGKLRTHSGYWSMAMGLAALSVAAAAIGSWTALSVQNVRDLARRSAGLQACGVARSAIDVAFWHAQRELVAPGSRLARWISDASAQPYAVPRSVLAPLDRLPGAGRLRVRVALSTTGRGELSPWGDACGLLVAAVVVVGSDGLERRASESRAFRIQRITPPPPLDGWSAAPRGGADLHLIASSERVINDPLALLDATPEARATAEALADPDGWNERAAWKVMARTPEVLARWVGRRLAQPRGRIDGVVFVDNRSGPPQRLRDVVFRGRALLVMTGRVALEDIRLADPARDRLTVVTYDAVELGGVVAASVVRLAGDGSEDAAASSGRVQLRGSLIDLTGASELPFTGTVMAPGDDDRPASKVVLVSPIRRPGPITRG